MSGTKNGWIKTKRSLIEKYGSEEAWKEHLRSIASIGGANGHTGGFSSTSVDSNGLTGSERARIYGRIGGQISRRKPRKVVD